MDEEKAKRITENSTELSEGAKKALKQLGGYEGKLTVSIPISLQHFPWLYKFEWERIYQTCKEN